MKMIRNVSFTQVFEYFFSAEIKNYIIENTAHNSYNLSLDELNKFLGIIIMSTFNVRKSQKDY